jgi:hypothetical protein
MSSPYTRQRSTLDDVLEAKVANGATMRCDGDGTRYVLSNVVNVQRCTRRRLEPKIKGKAARKAAKRARRSA